MPDGATTVLFQYGLAGVVIFGLSIAVVYLYKENQRLHAEKDALQELRRADAQETTSKVTEPLQSLSQTTRLILDKLLIAKGNK
jgi:hypothetical protein